MFTNFVPLTICDPKCCLVNTIAWAYKMGCDPSNLVFEVVGSHKVHDLGHLKRVLEHYQENVFKVALDDVESGFSNLESLVYHKLDFSRDRDQGGVYLSNGSRYRPFSGLLLFPTKP